MARTALDVLDDLILDGAQKISAATDEAIGLSHWALARAMLMIGVGLCILSNAVGLTMLRPGIIDYAITTAFVVMWLAIHKALSDRLSAQRASRDAGRALRVSERRVRTMDLLIVALLTVLQVRTIDLQSELFIAGLLAFHLHYYFKACDPPPPNATGRPAWSA